MTSTPLLSIIIPTKNRESLLKQTLAFTLEATADLSVEVVVVNDAEKKLELPEAFKSVTVYQNSGSGAATARNFGVTKTSAEWLLFLDDDMILSKENMIGYLDHMGQPGQSTINMDWAYPPDVIERITKTSFGRFLVANGFTTLAGWNRGLPWHANAVFEGSGITSQNLLIPRSLFNQSGGYPTNIPHAGSEDHIFSKKLKELGTKFLIDTRSCMFHYEIDRLEPTDWFQRKVRGGETRKAAVLSGYPEMEIHETPLERVFYSMAWLMEPILRGIVALTSLSIMFDSVSFMCYNKLLGIALHKGYRRYPVK